MLGRRTAAYRLRKYADNPRKEKEDMDVNECDKKRTTAEKQVLEILQNLENETGLSFGGIDTNSVRGVATPERIKGVSIKLELS